MRPGENPSVAQSGVECARVPSPTTDGMSTARPDLNFVPTLLGAGLSKTHAGGCEKNHEDESGRAHGGACQIKLSALLSDVLTRDASDRGRRGQCYGARLRLLRDSLREQG